MENFKAIVVEKKMMTLIFLSKRHPWINCLKGM